MSAQLLRVQRGPQAREKLGVGEQSCGGGGAAKEPAGYSINLLCKYLIRLFFLLHLQHTAANANHSCLAGS